MIILYFAVLIHFLFKMISCLRSSKKHFETNLIHCFHKSLYNLNHFSKFNFKFPIRMYLCGVRSRLTDRVGKLAVSIRTLRCYFEYSTDWMSPGNISLF